MFVCESWGIERNSPTVNKGYSEGWTFTENDLFIIVINISCLSCAEGKAVSVWTTLSKVNDILKPGATLTKVIMPSHNRGETRHIFMFVTPNYQDINL